MHAGGLSLTPYAEKNWYESLSNFVFKNLPLTLCKAEDHFKMITRIILEGANIMLLNLSCACWNKSGSQSSACFSLFTFLFFRSNNV